MLSTATDNEKLHVDPIENLLRNIPSVIERLNEANRNSEPNFVRLGSALQVFYNGAEEVAKISMKAGKSLDLESDACAVVDIRSLVTQAIDRLREASSGVFHSRDNVGSLISLLKTLDLGITNIKEIAWRLGIFGINISIQSTRSEHANKMFGDYSMEIKGFSKDISDRAELLTENIDDVRGILSSIGSDLDSGAQKLENMLGKAVQDAEEATTEIERLFRISQERLADIEAGSKEISLKVAEAVVAIQFNDITRQRIEHVVEALQEIEKVEDSAEIHTLLRLQCTQISGVVKDIHEARTKLSRSFDGLKTDIDGLARGRSAAQGKTRSSDPFSRLKALLQAVSRMLKDGERLGLRLSNALDNAVESSNQVAGHIKKVSSISGMLSLQAINAIIMSRQLGDAGISLGILAKEVQELSKDSEGQVRQVVRSLEGLADIVGTIKSRSTHENQEFDSASDVDQVVGEIIQSYQVYRESSQRSYKKADALATRFDEAENELFFLSELENEFAAILREINRLATDIEPLAKQGAEGEQDHLRKHLDRYTMQSERDAHLKFEDRWDEGTEEATNIETFDEQDQDEDLGDFELF